MSIVVPAILSQSRADLEEKLARLANVAAVEAVQIDTVDGRFAAPPCWPYTAGGTKEFAALVAEGMLPYAGRLAFEVDLMVSDPEQVTGAWLSVGATRITVHAESTTYLPKVITDLRVRYGHEKAFAPGLFSFGLALGLSSDVALIEPYIEYIDYVQFMGIAKIGQQRLPFDKRVLERVRSFKKNHPDTLVQIDGAVTLETAPELLAAGADRLVVGHALWEHNDPAAEIAKFDALAERTPSKVL